MTTVTPLSAALATVGTGLAAGGGLLTYALWEARQYTLRQVTVPILPREGELRILHLSDLHLTGHTEHRVRWVAQLAQLQPDLVVVTGDFLSNAKGIDQVGTALDGLLDLPGVFVLGSNDFFAAKPINPTKYVRGPSKKHQKATRLDTPKLLRTLTAGGWQLLNQETAVLDVAGFKLAFAGTGDAHHRLDHYEEVANTWPDDADLRIGVTHAPYLRVLDAMAADGAEMIFAGHTHGGQVCRPDGLAFVTNCDIEPERAKGLSKHGTTWLHVSAGLGTNPYTPIRVACRPEATLLTLIPVQPGTADQFVESARGAV